MRALVAAASLLVVAAPVFAQDNTGVNRDHGSSASTPSDPRHTGDLDEKGERLICRTVQTSSTSHMSARRVCHTETEWRVIQSNSR